MRKTKEFFRDTKEKWKKQLKSFKWTQIIGLTIGGIINAFGVTLFLTPVNILDGGISGLSFLLTEVCSPYVSLGLFLFVLNFPFFIFALRKHGIVFVGCSLYGIGIYSLFAFLFRDVMLVAIKNPSPIIGVPDATSEFYQPYSLILGAIFGGLFSGIGSGLTIRFGGALDGVEVMAVSFAKKIGITVGTFVMIFNIIMYGAAVGVFWNSVPNPWTIPLFSVIAYAVGVKTIDFIVEGFDKSKTAMIVSAKKDEICEALSKEFKRGLTIINATGYYSNSEKFVIYCVVNRFEISKLKRIVHENDSDAFVTISDVSDVLTSHKKADE